MKNTEKPSVIIIAGPTGVGKTSVVLKLAKKLGGEIIGADAMQIYRYMDIGTAKPTPHEQAIAPHHLIDVVNPNEPFDAAKFKDMAGSIIKMLHKKGCPIYAAGGTGLYIKALTRGLFSEKGKNEKLRADLKKEAQNGADLHKRLKKCDPDAAARIHPNDSYRIIRALEIYEITGKTISQHHKDHNFSKSPYRVFKIGLIRERDILYERINLRVDAMINQGFYEEVQGLLKMGYSSSLKSMKSLGYRHICDFIEGRFSWEEAVRLLKQDTRRYAKRQLTWFKADPDIIWIEPEQINSLYLQIVNFLKSG
ncbi:tRNA dimethylallyltransferase [Candidatus Magnetomoraceae bacterium gMMP-15]